MFCFLSLCASLPAFPPYGRFLVAPPSPSPALLSPASCPFCGVSPFLDEAQSQTTPHLYIINSLCISRYGFRKKLLLEDSRLVVHRNDIHCALLTSFSCPPRRMCRRLRKGNSARGGGRNLASLLFSEIALRLRRTAGEVRRKGSGGFR
ncbi:hypothetical protein SAY87_013823 [Trapa incisa]|uniref:Uncharacterized protein n=1 Tax=Trapa incisa TaxID=236973 RepID=A0AAN7KBV2_9MYRT|nr:hypothetical protein SAY87_013823 [Trapa incisa]